MALGEAESERDRLAKVKKEHDKLVAAAGKLEERNSRLEQDVQDLKGKLAFAQEDHERERRETDEVVQKSKMLLQEKIDEFRNQKRAYEGLQEENKQMNHYKRTAMLLEQEKRELESKVVQLAVEQRKASTASSAAASSSSGAGGGGAGASSSDDEPELRGQVDFLNSVIVDMQRKNDELKERVELLESATGFADDNAGVSSREAAFLFNGVSSRQVPPRLFCDICDAFDVHDTEDCPTQAQVEVEESGHTRSGARRPGDPAAQPRPYCESCEVFGHWQGECDNETF